MSGDHQNEGGEGGKAGVVEGTARAVAAIVKEVPVYKDALQPAAQEVGKALATPLSLLNTAVRPVRSIMLGINLAFDRLDEELRKRLSGLPAEKIVEPSVNVSGPLLLAYPFAEGEPPLRDMFAELLATAMSADKRHLAHPSFVEIIRQLSSDDAQLFAEIARQGDRIPIANVVHFDMRTQGERPLILLSDLKAVPVSRFPTCLTSLERLGLVRTDLTRRLLRPGIYDGFQKRPEVVALRSAIPTGPQSFEDVRVVGGFLEQTPFGREFTEACLPQRTTTPESFAWGGRP